MTTLRLSPAAIITPNQHGILFQSDLGSFQLHGADITDFIHRIMPMLEAAIYDEADISKKLSNYDRQSIDSILTMLKARGVIETCDEKNHTTPPWQAHERFLRPWTSPEKKSSEYLAQLRVLVVGLEPWSATMIDELANCGLGTIHILDSELLTDDDILCYRAYSQENLGQLRADALQKTLVTRAPWCTVTHEPIQLNSHEQLVVTKNIPFDLVIVTLAQEAQYWLSKTSEFIHRHQYETLYGSLDGLESWIGPVVNPNDGHACWNCMRLRRLGTETRPDVAHLLEQNAIQSQTTRRARSTLSPMSAITGQQLAMEAIKLLLQYTPSTLAGKVLVQNLVSNESDTHTIIPVPWCSICGYHHGANDDNISSPNPTHYAAMSAVSAHRTQKENPLRHIKDITEFNNLFSGWIDSRVGVIKQFNGHLDSLPEFPRTASAGLSSYTLGNYDPRNTGQIGSGKGLDDVSAHISALGEAIERYSAARYNLNNLTYASISQLTGDYIDPETLVLYSQKQYNSLNFPFTKWKRKQKIHWTKGTWLGTDTATWVPALTTYFNFSCPIDEQFSQVSSNGLAAGQHHQDAAMRATYELIERDAMMLTWYAQLPCQRLSIDSHYHGKMRIMIDDLIAKGIALEVYLLDVGLHVPTVVCLALGDGFSTPAASVSLATHGDIAIAMQKALLEQGHVIPYLCHLMSRSVQRPQQATDVKSLEDHAAYYFSKNKLPAFDFMRQPESAAISISAWPYPVVQDIADLRTRVTNAGVDIAIVDVTSPDVQLSPFKVARAVGIHMQPIHFGEQFKRIDNPRLRKLLKGKAVNSNPHPIA